LLEIAASSGLVTKVVSRLGFSKADLLVDHDGEMVAVWSFQTAN
jgi:hypothetical protein